MLVGRLLPLLWTIDEGAVEIFFIPLLIIIGDLWPILRDVAPAAAAAAVVIVLITFMLLLLFIISGFVVMTLPIAVASDRDC